MADKVFISRAKALGILITQGDFCESQAVIVLGHSLKQSYEGQEFYPADYIMKRARDNVARAED